MRCPTNVSQMYAECFDKVFSHVNSRILKCKMTNVITRSTIMAHEQFIGEPFISYLGLGFRI